MSSSRVSWSSPTGREANTSAARELAALWKRSAGLLTQARELDAHFFRMLAQRRHLAVGPRGSSPLRGRRRTGGGPARRVHFDAAQMRMSGELGRPVDARKGDLGGGELLHQLRERN